MDVVELTVGRHEAHEGAEIDPIVAAALSRRSAAVGPGGARHGQGLRQQALSSGGEGGLGWPGDPADGSGLGWPTDALQAQGPAQPGVTLVEEQAPARRRGGWRRLFGGSTAA